MKRLTVLTAAILITSLFANATVWRLNNTPGVNAHFTGTLQEALDEITTGDTIYVEPSMTAYGDASITKQVTLIGAGYWLAENDTTQAYKQESKVGRLVFDQGSQGSLISGLYVSKTMSISNSGLIDIKVNDITIQRCYIYLIGYYSSTIYVDGNRNNVFIMQNWIYAHANAQASIYGIRFSGIPQNAVVKNNFIRSIGGPEPYCIYMNMENSDNLLFMNNILWGNIVSYNASHINNISLSGTLNAAGGNFTANNLCNGTQYPDENGNLQEIDMTTVFLDHDKYIDNGYLFVFGSPAIGAGINGGDCGAFGNGFDGTPYVLSGIPNIPSIFEFTAPIITDTIPLQINIKAISRN